MSERTDIWTYLLVTAVTVLIWSWAAAETQVERDLKVTLAFEVGAGDDWFVQRVSPNVGEVEIAAKGTRRALSRFEREASTIRIDRPAEIGEDEFDVLEAVQNSTDLEGASITILSTRPQRMTIKKDKVVRRPARVELGSLEDIETRGPAEVTPTEVTVVGPSLVLDAIDDLAVDVEINRATLLELTPGVQHTRTCRVVGPPALGTNTLVTFDPPEVDLTLTITRESIVREVSPPGNVRVQIAGSPEDKALVAVDPVSLNSVVVTAASELADQIEANEVTVFAIVYLKSSETDALAGTGETEAQIKKPVSFFIALHGDGTSTFLDAQVTDPDEREITISIAERSAAAE